MSGLFKDFRYGARALAHAPAFTLAVVAVLAVGIAANTAVFTFADDLLWRTLPAQDPGRLVRIYNGYTHGFQWGSSSYPTFEELSAMAGTFDGMIGEAYLPLGLELAGSAHRIWGAMVTPGYFDLLTVRPAFGRFFGAADATVPGEAPWAVISEGFWRRHYGGSPDAVGARLRINGYPLTVIGVSPGTFRGTQTGVTPEVWIPVTMQPLVLPGEEWLESRRARPLWLIGRRAKGVTIEATRAALATRAAGLKARYPVEYESLATLNVLPEVEGGFHPFYREPFARFFAVLMVVVAIVLVVACSNAAGLLLARGTTRAREIAIRRAVGAGTGRVLRQLLAESLLAAMMAGGLGIGLATLAVRFVSGFQPPTDIPLSFGFDLDGRVLGFSLLVTVLTAVLFGLLPAVRTARTDLADSLRSRSGDDRSGSRLRAAIVVGQVALSMALLIGAGLFLRSLGNATSVDLGFVPDGVRLGSVDLAPRGYGTQAGQELYRQLQERLAAEPDIESVALAARLPFGLDPAPARVAPVGREIAADGSEPTVEYNVVSPSFFETVRTRIVRGRGFTPADDAEAGPVAVVSVRMAADFWPDDRAVGRRFESLGRTWEIVGVAEDTKFRTLSGETLPYFYLPLAQRYSPEATVFARTRPGTDVEALLREHVGALDASVPVFGIKSLNEQVGVALLPARMAAGLLAVFGALTLGLAAIGLYGVLAYTVELRRRELGVRLALGAHPRDLLRSMVGHGVRLAGIGLALGLAIGLGLSRLMAGLLYGVSPTDPASYLATTVVLGAVAVIASLLPALRAAAVDPAIVLRDE